MTFEEKEELFRNAFPESLYIKSKKKKYYSGLDINSISKYQSTTHSLDALYFYTQWISGGVGGGSCWDDGDEDHHYSISGEKEANLIELEDLLLKLVPNISYLQFRKIEGIIKHDVYEVNEYYGNSTTYNYKILNLKELFDKLIEMNLL